MTKSIASLLYGMALADGLVPGLDESLIDQFPVHADLAADPRRRKILVRHALSMQMATKWSEDLPYTDPRNSEIAMEMAADRYRYFLDRPMVGEPGGGWTYNGGATSVIAGLIAKGVGKPIDVYARETLFATLGIERFEWFVGSDADHQRDAQPDDAYHLLPDRHARAFAAAFIEEFQHVISPGVRLLTAP